MAILNAHTHRCMVLTAFMTALFFTGCAATLPSAADQMAYSGALQLKDKTLCGKISNPEFMRQCEADVGNKIIVDEAVEKSDASLCKQISDRDMENTCEIQVEVQQKTVEQEKQKQELVEKEYKIRDEAFAKMDISMCGTLTTWGVKRECEFNITAQEARQQKNPALCDGLDLDMQQQCRDAVNH